MAKLAVTTVTAPVTAISAGPTRAPALVKLSAARASRRGSCGGHVRAEGLVDPSPNPLPTAKISEMAMKPGTVAAIGPSR